MAFQHADTYLDVRREHGTKAVERLRPSVAGPHR